MELGPQRGPSGRAHRTPRTRNAKLIEERDRLDGRIEGLEGRGEDYLPSTIHLNTVNFRLGLLTDDP